MIGYIITFLVGGLFGVLTMALGVAAKSNSIELKTDEDLSTEVK